MTKCMFALLLFVRCKSARGSRPFTWQWTLNGPTSFGNLQTLVISGVAAARPLPPPPPPTTHRRPLHDRNKSSTRCWGRIGGAADMRTALARENPAFQSVIRTPTPSWRLAIPSVEATLFDTKRLTFPNNPAEIQLITKRGVFWCW